MDIRDQLSQSEIESLLADNKIILFKGTPKKPFTPIYISNNVIQITGFEPSYFKFEGKRWTDQIHPDDREKAMARYDELFTSGQIEHLYRFKRKDGVYIWLREKANLVRDDEGDPQYLFGLVQDITEIRKNGDGSGHAAAERSDRPDLESRPVEREDAEQLSLKMEEWIIQRSLELDERIQHQKKIERKLRKRLLYEYALSECSVLLLSSPDDETFDETLNILMEVTDSDRVYISKNYIGPGGDLYSTRIHEVCREGVEAQIGQPSVQNRSYKSFPWWYENLSNGKIICGSVDEIPSPEWEMLKTQNVRSILVLPLHIEDEWYGFLGFENVQRERDWQEEEITLLRTAANIMGASKKRQAEMQQKTFEGDLLGSDLLDLLPGKFLILDKEGSFYRVGRSLQEFTGYSEEELRGQPFMELVDVDEREEAGSFIDSVLVSGEQQAELTLIGRKGESLSIILKGGRFQEKGNTFIIGNVFRMSGSDLYNKGYEDATRDHESILKEIHHRIKNNLSIIVTLFEMQKEETEDKNLKWLLTESQNRVKTFALLHEKLYQIGKKSDIPFHHYVQELIDRLGSIYRYKDRVVDLELNTDSFMLSLDKALPFGLLINEILSNAYEHAFTNRSEGVINVEIRQQENRVWARLSDNGKGIKNPEELKQADTLGMTLIKNFLRQLDAKWSMHNGDGLTYELVFEQ